MTQRIPDDSTNTIDRIAFTITGNTMPPRDPDDDEDEEEEEEEEEDHVEDPPVVREPDEE